MEKSIMTIIYNIYSHTLTGRVVNSIHIYVDIMKVYSTISKR